MIRLNKYFLLAELVPPDIYVERGDAAKEFLSPRLLHILYVIREELGRPITINNWHLDVKHWETLSEARFDEGRFRYRGFRPLGCKVGAKYSQHRFGRAVDFDVQGMTAQEVRDWLKENFMEKISPRTGICSITLESGVNWVHLDVRNPRKGPGVHIFKP